MADTSKQKRSAGIIVAGVVAAIFCATAHAGEVRLISPSAMNSSLEPLVEAHRKQTGDEVKLRFETAPVMRKLFAAGEETTDIVIAPPPVLDEIIKTGKALSDGSFVLGRVGAGVAVRNGAPVPDVSTVEALKKAVLEADSVIYNRASSGLYIASLLEKLGLSEQIKGKTKIFADAEETFTHILSAKDRHVGFGGLTEIVRWRGKGLRLAGPLPAEVQNYTAYAVALSAAPPNPEGARALLKFLASPAARAILTEYGVDK